MPGAGGRGAVPHLLGWVQDVTHRPAVPGLCAPGSRRAGGVGASPGQGGSPPGARNGWKQQL